MHLQNISYRSCSTSYSDTSTAANWECGLWCVQYSIRVPCSTWGECGQDHVCPSCAVLYARKLTPFPKESKKVHRCRKRHLFIPLYCTCGFLESYDSHMISCDGCGQWFHYRCMHIKTPPPDTWFCSHCSKN